MKFALLAAALIAWWAWKTRETRALRLGDVAAVVAAVVGIRFGSKGNALLAIVALGGAGWWYWFRRTLAVDSLPAKDESGSLSPEEARSILGVTRRAGEDEIRAAHRRLLLKVHPDLGGTADETALANAARDTLLARRT
jgi:hypothetical protein